MPTDDFDGSFNTVAVLSITPPLGGPTVVNIQGIESLTPPTRQHKKDTWTVISGERSGKEQQALCSEQAGTIEGTLTYELSRYIELDALHGINGCAIVLQASDGLLFSGKGGLEKLTPPKMEDSRHGSSDFTIAVDAGWIPTDGGDGVLNVGTYLKSMVGGSGTIDLTACGAGGIVNLTGYNVTRFYFKAPSTNDGPITIETGDPNGYTLASPIVLPPGDEIEIDIAPENYLTVADGVKILDLSGTLTDGVQVAIRAVLAE